MKKQSNVPQIRFQNFEELWKDDKLKNIFRTIRNAFVGTATPYYVEEGNFYLESNNVKNGKINYNSQIFINVNTCKSYCCKFHTISLFSPKLHYLSQTAGGGFPYYPHRACRISHNTGGTASSASHQVYIFS